jgi:hypothetical protein
MLKLYHFLHEHPVVSGEVVKNIEYISHILCWQAQILQPQLIKLLKISIVTFYRD